MNKRVYGFEQYKQLVKEGSYKPGFITEYEEGTSIDDLNNDAAPAEDMPTEDAIPEGDAAEPVDDTAVATDDTATEDAIPEADAAEPVDDTAVATDDTATEGDSSDAQKKLELVSGVFGKYAKFANDGGDLDDGMKAKIDAAYKILNDSE